MFAGVAGLSLTTGSVVWLAVQASSGWDGSSLGQFLAGLAACITAIGGAVLVFRPRRDLTQERLLELLEKQLERDHEDDET